MTLGAIVLFTVTPCHPHDNAPERGCEKGYCADLAFVVGVVPFVVVVVFFLIYITVYCILLQ